MNNRLLHLSVSSLLLALCLWVQPADAASAAQATAGPASAVEETGPGSQAAPLAVAGSAQEAWQ